MGDATGNCHIALLADRLVGRLQISMLVLAVTGRMQPVTVEK
jgi:hypothetical protein